AVAPRLRGQRHDAVGARAGVRAGGAAPRGDRGAAGGGAGGGADPAAAAVEGGGGGADQRPADLAALLGDVAVPRPVGAGAARRAGVRGARPGGVPRGPGGGDGVALVTPGVAPRGRHGRPAERVRAARAVRAVPTAAGRALRPPRTSGDGFSTPTIPSPPRKSSDRGSVRNPG